MNSQEKINYLSQIPLLNDKINTFIKSNSVKKSEALIDCLPSAMTYDNDGTVNGTKNNSSEIKITNYIDKIKDYENELDAKVDEYYDTKRAITNLIESVQDNNQQRVLVRRYLKNQHFENIAVDMNYSIRRIYQMHDEGLRNIKI